MREFGYAYFLPTTHLLSEWAKLESECGQQDFDAIVRSIDASMWDEIEDVLGKGRRWARLPEQFGPIQPFVDLVVKVE